MNNVTNSTTITRRAAWMMGLLSFLLGLAIMYFLHIKCLLPKNTYNKCCSVQTDTIADIPVITNHVAYRTDSVYSGCTGCDSFLITGPDVGHLMSSANYTAASDLFYSMHERLPAVDSRGVRMHRCVLEALIKSLDGGKGADEYVYFRYGIENVAGKNRIFLMARGGNNWMAGGTPPEGITMGPEMLPLTYRCGTSEETYCPSNCR